MAVIGKLRIVPSGELGPLVQAAEAITYDWKWYYTASASGIWLVLIGAMVLPKSNRNPTALLILVPLAVVTLLWWLFTKKAGMNSSDQQEFSLIFSSVAVGVTVLWSMAHNLARFRGHVRFLLSFGILVMVAGLNSLFNFGEASSETGLMLALFVFMALTMLAAITLSRRQCRGECRPVLFLLWLALWTVLTSVFATFGFLIAASIITSSGLGFPDLMWIFLLGGLMFGLFLYILNLPFMILGFASPFFRKRLCGCLSLKTPTSVPLSDVDSLGEL